MVGSAQAQARLRLTPHTHVVLTAEPNVGVQASADEVESTIAEVYARAADPTTLMGNTRVIQAWGTKPSVA